MIGMEHYVGVAAAMFVTVIFSIFLNIQEVLVLMMSTECIV